MLDVSPSPLLPQPLRAGGRFLAGSPTGAEAADPLHAGHALVIAAIAEARSATSQPARVKLRADAAAPGVAQTRRGRRGRLVVVKIAYAGLEPVERLLPVAIMEGDASPTPNELAHLLLGLHAEDVPSFEPPKSDPRLCAEALSVRLE